MKKLIFVCIFVFLFSGCTGHIAINTDPIEANVYKDGQFVGVSPCTVEYSEFDDQITVRVEKKGYKPQARIIIPQQKVASGFGSAQVGSFGSANVYGNNPYGTASGYGNYSNNTFATGQTMYVETTWPSQVFFKLEPETKTEKEKK